MARITVEDCIDKFPSRFELVLVASNRARKLFSGEKPTVEIDNDKNTVIALREIAEETLTTDQLKNDLIQEYQTNTFVEDEDIDEIEDNSNEDKLAVDESVVNELQEDNENKSEDNSSDDFAIEEAVQNNIENNNENTKTASTNETSQDYQEILSDEDKI